MSVRIPQTHTVTHPLGEYEAEIGSIKPDEGDYGPQLVFTFMLDDAEGNVVPLTGWTSQIFSDRSKLYAWTKAALGGHAIPKEYAFDSDDLIGKLVLLTLTVHERTDGSTFNKILSMRAKV